MTTQLIAELLLTGMAMCAVAMRWSRFSGTTLRAPAVWTLISLASLLVIELIIELAGLSDSVPVALRYVGSASTCCPLMALLGAKRPQDVGWQWIVVTLWIVLVLPVGETLVLWQGGALEIGPFRKWFLVILMLVAIGNYGLTRFALPVLLCVLGQAVLLQPHLPLVIDVPGGRLSGFALVCFGICVAFGQTRRRGKSDGWNTVWIDFRNAFGLVWSLRIMERLNATSRLSDWDAQLGWFGFERFESMEEHNLEFERAVRTLLRRFVSPEWIHARLGDKAPQASRMAKAKQQGSDQN